MNAPGIEDDWYESTLYRKVLGPDWARLPQSVRSAHRPNSPTIASGRFSVAWGANPIARLIAVIAGLPRPGENLASTLQIFRIGDDEIWMRRIGDFDFGSRLRYLRDGEILETIHPLIFRLKVTVTPSGSLHYTTTSVLIRIGGIKIPLPRFLSPLVHALEKSGSTDEESLIVVSVVAPIAGLLLEYAGVMNRS